MLGGYCVCDSEIERVCCISRNRNGIITTQNEFRITRCQEHVSQPVIFCSDEGVRQKFGVRLWMVHGAARVAWLKAKNVAVGTYVVPLLRSGQIPRPGLRGFHISN